MNKPIIDNTEELIFEPTFLDKEVMESKRKQIEKALSLSKDYLPSYDQREQARTNLYVFASIIETYFDDLVIQVKRTAEYKAFNTRVKNLLSKPYKMKKIPWGLKVVNDRLEFINGDYLALFKLVVFYRIKKGLLKTRLFNTINEEAGHLLKVTCPPDTKGLNRSNQDSSDWKNQNDLERIIKRYKVYQ